MIHLFTINPAAGKSDSTGKIVAEIGQVFGRRLDDYEIYITKGPGDCTAYLKRYFAAHRERPARVYACGGDGTLNEALNGVAGLENVSLACYPCGTANDFIKIFGLHNTPRFKDIASLVDAGEARIDLIRCSANDRHDGRYSLNICSVGLDARVARDVHRYSKLPLIKGVGAYILSLVINTLKGIAQDYTITIDGAEARSKYAIVLAANGRYYGGSFYAVPEALPDDGQCDFLVVPKIGLITFLQVIGIFKNGGHREVPQYIKWSRGESLRVRSAKPFAANADGETWLTDDVTFTVVKNALSFVVPEGLTWSNGKQTE